MSQIVILDSNTLSVVDWYFADSPYVPVTPGIRLEVPEGLSWDVVKGVAAEDGTVTLEADPLKVQGKLDAAWTQLRAERNARLAATDWVALADAHLSQDRKDAWFAYRQELRDLPDLVTDPLSVEWPLDPTQAPVVPVSGSRLSSLLTHADVEPVVPVVDEEVTVVPVVEESPVVEPVPVVEEAPVVEEVTVVPEASVVEEITEVPEASVVEPEPGQ